MTGCVLSETCVFCKAQGWKIRRGRTALTREEEALSPLLISPRFFHKQSFQMFWQTRQPLPSASPGLDRILWCFASIPLIGASFLKLMSSLSRIWTRLAGPARGGRSAFERKHLCFPPSTPYTPYSPTPPTPPTPLHPLHPLLPLLPRTVLIEKLALQAGFGHREEDWACGEGEVDL